MEKLFFFFIAFNIQVDFSYFDVKHKGKKNLMSAEDAHMRTLADD